MEPVVEFSGIALTIAEILFGVLLLMLGVFISLFFRRSGKEDSERLQRQLHQMGQQQTELQGRLSQFAETTAQRDAVFHENLDARLSNVSERVGASLLQTQEKNAASLTQLHERLALIDRAQKNIETLSGEVSGLQNLLSNKQARGAFGEKQMQDLIETYLPPNAYSFQHTLSNNRRVDALIHLPAGQGDVAIDSKFPMEAWRRLTASDNSPDAQRAKREFAADVSRHIKDVASKYLIFGETHDLALLFLPSEAIYAELHANFPEVIEKGFASKVMIVSPTTFMATLHTMRAVMRDAAMREQAHIIQREVGMMAKDVSLLDERVGKLQTHFNQSTEDIRKIRISTEKITKRADKIDSLDMPDTDKAANISGDNVESFKARKAD